MQTAVGDFVAVGMHTSTPKYFWKGTVLAEVHSVVAHVDEDTHHLKLRVSDTPTYDAMYAEMQSAGISIKKVRV